MHRAAQVDAPAYVTLCRGPLGRVVAPVPRVVPVTAPDSADDLVVVCVVGHDPALALEQVPVPVQSRGAGGCDSAAWAMRRVRRNLYPVSTITHVVRAEHAAGPTNTIHKSHNHLDIVVRSRSRSDSDVLHGLLAGRRGIWISAGEWRVVDVAVGEELVWIEVFEVQLIICRVRRELFLFAVVRSDVF